MVEIVEIIPELSNEEYHSGEEYSSSFVKNVVKYGVEQAIKEKDVVANKAMLLGSAWHSFLEGADVFEQEVAVFDDSGIMQELSQEYTNVRATNAYRDFKAEFEDSNQGKIVMTNDEYNQFLGMKQSMEENAWVNEYCLNFWEYEHLDEWSYIWSYEGLNFRTRPDRQIIDRFGDLMMVADWKSCKDALSYKKDIKKWRHDISAIMYCMPLDIEPDRFFFIATDKSEPYITKEWGLKPKTIRKAYKDFHIAIRKIKHYNETGEDLHFTEEVDRV